MLGGIELDPASCKLANRAIEAERFCTVETDGLAREWKAETVFLNPPYGRRDGVSNQLLWSQKLIAEYQAGNVGAAILLVNAATSEKWFKPLFDFPLCFTDHRIRYVPPPERVQKDRPTKGNAFAYFGNNSQAFFREFAAFGRCVVSVDGRSSLL